jgi:acetyl-CoA acyltransferase
MPRLSNRRPATMDAAPPAADEALGRSVVVIDAVRTPFVKSFGAYETESALSLSLHAARTLINRVGVSPDQIGEVVWGAVVPQIKNPNIARDIVLFAGLPRSIPGFTLNKACASSLQSVQSAADSIALGRVDLALAGGVEVLTDVPITYSDKARQFLTRFSRAKNLKQKIALISSVSPKDFLPRPPALAEPFTGLTMGEHGEIMAVKNKITRLRQDEYALMTHHRAHAAIESGYLTEEVTPIWTGKKSDLVVDRDNIVRGDTNLEDLAKLRPAFDKKYGTITAGNSSALTDGASAVLLADEDFARRHSLPILGRILASHTVAVDPLDQLLIGPAYAVPQLLKRHGLSMGDVGVFEIHEAFAAQVLSCLDAMADEEFCQSKLGLKKAFGSIPMDKLNIDGSSLAYGHPFGATGGRLISRALRIAARTGSKRAVIGACAAGGMSQAMLLEVP